MTERDLIRFDRIVEVNRDDQVAVYFDISELASLVAAARAGIALAGIADPAAFISAVRELRDAIEKDTGGPHQSAHKLIALLPEETADA